jgi:hypothetical protein
MLGRQLGANSRSLAHSNILDHISHYAFNNGIDAGSAQEVVQATDGAIISTVDRRNRLDEDSFSYRATKSGSVLISWQGKQITTLNGRHAERFLAEIAGVGDRAGQLVMAKATGNFKRGNERQALQSDKMSSTS